MAGKFYFPFEHVAFIPLDKKLVLSKTLKALANSFIVCLQGFLRTSLLFRPGQAVIDIDIRLLGLPLNMAYHALEHGEAVFDAHRHQRPIKLPPGG